MRCCKWLCEEEKPTVLGLLSEGNKRQSEDMIKACKAIGPMEAVGKEWLFTISRFARIYVGKN